jgi:hypothetical protein
MLAENEGNPQKAKYRKKTGEEYHLTVSTEN